MNTDCRVQMPVGNGASRKSGRNLFVDMEHLCSWSIGRRLAKCARQMSADLWEVSSETVARVPGMGGCI